MNSRSLLPDNASPLEHNLAQTGSMIEQIPVPLRSLWQADCCPSPSCPIWHGRSPSTAGMNTGQKRQSGR